MDFCNSGSDTDVSSCYDTRRKNRQRGAKSTDTDAERWTRNADPGGNSTRKTSSLNSATFVTHQGHKHQSCDDLSYINLMKTGYESAGSRPNFNKDEENDEENQLREKEKMLNVKACEGQVKKNMFEKLKEMTEKNNQLEELITGANCKNDEMEEKITLLSHSLKDANKKMRTLENEKVWLEKLLAKCEKEKDSEHERMLQEVDRINKRFKKNIHLFVWIASVLVLVPLCIGLHSVFKGHEMKYIELRVMLVGKTGAGKSASGNTILGEEAFRVEASPASVTAGCRKKNKLLDGRNITIIDTPGVMDTWLSSNQTAQNAHKCISMSTPDPHIFLLVIRLGRFTVEERNAVKWIQENFGDEALKFTMILFTGGDLLEGKTVEKFISNSYDLQNLVDICEGKYHVFNNYERRNRTQVAELFEKISAILHLNMGYYYTKEVHQKVRRSTREEEEKKRVALEEVVKMEEERKRVALQQEMKSVEEKKRAMMEKLIREEEKMKSEQLANEVKEEARSECNVREREIRKEEDLKRRNVEEKMEVEERRKVNEIVMKLRDEQLENKNLKAELEHAYNTSFWFKFSTGLFVLSLIVVLKVRQKQQPRSR